MKTDFHGRHGDWERELDRRLAELPELAAPPSLIGRVNAALEAQTAVPWWRCAWWFWPVPVRVASLALLAGAAALLGLLYAEIREAVLASYWQHTVAEWRTAIDPFVQVFHALGRAAEIVVRQLCGTACLLVAGASLSLYLLCVGVGTALYRTLRAVRVNV